MATWSGRLKTLAIFILVALLLLAYFHPDVVQQITASAVAVFKP